MLAAPDAVYPQFATHNAQTLASVLIFAGPNFYRGQYEFQCLHGMGEPLYEEVVGRDKLDRPCRVYAPVGSHETLLAYLVRRLLENGANTSFVNRIADASVAVDELVADPVTHRPRDPPARRAAREDRAAARPLRRPIARTRSGLDFSDEQRLANARQRAREATALGPRGAPFRRARPPDEPGEPVLQPRRSVRRCRLHASRACRRDCRAAIDVGDRAGAGVGPRSRRPSGLRSLRRAADLLEAEN